MKAALILKAVVRLPLPYIPLSPGKVKAKAKIFGLIGVESDSNGKRGRVGTTIRFRFVFSKLSYYPRSVESRLGESLVK